MQTPRYLEGNITSKGSRSTVEVSTKLAATSPNYIKKIDDALFLMIAEEKLSSYLFFYSLKRFIDGRFTT
jgi:hypothetical protein